MADPWAEFLPAAPAAGNDPWADFIPAKPDMATDIAKSTGTGLAKGAIGIAGIPADAWNLMSKGTTYGLLWAAERAGLLPNGKKASDFFSEADALNVPRQPIMPPSSAEIQKGIEQVTGPFHQPQTMPGRVAETVAEFLPGGAIGGANSLPQFARQVGAWGVAPGVAAAGAGELTRGTGYEGPAKIGAALLAGGGAALATRPSQAGAMVSQASRGMARTELDAMEALMRDAQAMGLPLTRAEAAQAVSNGATRLADLQRVAEGNGAMRPFMAQRPQQVEAVGRQAMDQIAPVPQAPSMVGPQVGEAASGIVNDVQSAINRTTRPLYDQAAQARVGLPVSRALEADPLYAQALAEVRGNPALNRTIENLPNDSPAVLDLVQRRLGELAQNARAPGQASTSNLAAANYQDARTAPIAAAETATGSRPGVMGDYEAARAMQSQLREQYLAPIVNGPIGKLAQKDITTQNAINALFPRNPVPNSAPEVQQAVQALSARNPWAARQLVRAHAEQTFNQATRDLQSGANQFGGANFAVQLRGNFQQDANFLAALSALPNGQQIMAGFDRMMQVMAATGERQRIGSQTAFNIEAQTAMKQGGAMIQGGALAAGLGMKLPSRIMERVQQWNMGRNTDEIARLLTDPDAASSFRALAEAPMGSAKAAAAMSRLIYIGERGQKKE